MGYTVVENNLLDAANEMLGDAAFRILIMLVRETKAVMRWGTFPGKVADADMPSIRLGITRLGFKMPERKYYAAVKELEDKGFAAVLRNPGTPMQASLLPSLWQQQLQNPCKNEGGAIKNPCKIDGEVQEHSCENDSGKRTTPRDNDRGSTTSQYINNTCTTSNTASLPNDTVAQGVPEDSGEEVIELKKKEKMHEISGTEPDEALPLLDVLHRRYYGSPMPEQWRLTEMAKFMPPGTNTSDGGECPSSEFLESANAFDDLLDRLDKAWRSERETLSGSMLQKRQCEVTALSSVLGDMHDCWRCAERLRGKLFLQYHTIGRRHARAGTAGSPAHLRELAVMLCQCLGLEPSSLMLGKIAALMRKYSRIIVVEQAEMMRYPSDRNGIRDVVAVMAHRLSKIEAIPLPC